MGYVLILWHIKNQSTMNEHNLLGRVSGGTHPKFSYPPMHSWLWLSSSRAFSMNLQAWSSEIIAGLKVHPTPVIKETLGLWRQFHILPEFYCKREASNKTNQFMLRGTDWWNYKMVCLLTMSSHGNTLTWVPNQLLCTWLVSHFPTQRTNTIPWLLVSQEHRWCSLFMRRRSSSSWIA